MKKFFTKKRLLIGGSSFFFLGLLLFIFLDAFYAGNFRSMQGIIWSTQDIDLRGLREMRASGGTSIRFPDLKFRLRNVEGPKFIVDGMAEYHGYVKGIPTTFFGYQRHGPALKHYIRRLIFTGSLDIQPDLVVAEGDVARENGFSYRKVNIGSNFIETDENIDDIVSFYDQVPENAWLHFHCAHGKGRTSTLLIMLDSMKNAPLVSLEEIVKRQHLLGSEDLFNTKVWKNGTYDKKKLEARKKFVEEFYAFVCQRKKGGIQKWSDWKKHQSKSGSTFISQGES